MTDQTIPAGLHPDDVVLARDFVGEYRDSTYAPDRTVAVARVLAALLSAPQRPTLADMTMEEQDECTGMQADLAQGDRVVILDGTPDHDGLVQVLEKSLDVYRAYPAEVTPRPDLPHMEWPGTEKAAPAPALPEGWRLADHKKHGRVIVTTTTPRRDGRVYFVLPAADHFGFDWHFCDPSALTYPDQEADQ